tara:strand:- start:83480 stop:84379 length:900 start_codon:yes stop_codon:yes gene_type:complete
MENFTLYFLGIIALLGLFVGSFLNVVIYRLPIMLQRDWLNQCTEFLSETCHITLPEPQSTPKILAEPQTFNLALPASTCKECRTKIKFYDNIPVISYLILRGKCRNCHTHISIRYPFIELLTAVLSIITALYFGKTLTLLIPALILTWSLIALTWIDIDEQILPDNITLPLLWMGLLLNIPESFCPLPQAIIGAVVGYLSLWSLYWIFKLLTGKEGMGYGDFKLMAMLGAWMGIKSLLPIILLSSLVGAVVGITLIVLKKQHRDNPIPFGPFIAAAGWITFIWGDEIIQAYLRFSGLSV